jgi:hypothetical protein
MNEEITTMNNHRTSVSFRRAGRLASGSLLTLALLASPHAQATENQVAARAADPVIKRDHTGWSFNATPVLIVPENGYGWGGGADPEVKYTFAFGWARLSAGARIGAYYAADQFGLSATPTVRAMVPIGNFEP